jgi:hypothetical protein
MIYVFKTTVNTENEVELLRPYIDKVLPSTKWNFDLEDCDKILRIDSTQNVIDLVKILFKIHDFKCEELK